MKKIAVAAICATALSTGASAQEGKTLTYAEFEPVQTNWQMGSSDAFLGSRAGCFEALVRVNGELKLEPGLATSWKQLEPTVWEFTLRDGVKFQDDAPLTAEAAAGALNHLLAEKVPARPFSPKLIKSVEAVGEKVVRITTQTPSVLLPAQLAAPNTAILSPAAYQGEIIDPVGRCTGPFEIVEVKPKEYVKLKRNDDYWGGKPALEGGMVVFIPDANTRMTQVRSGEADIARLIPSHGVKQLEGVEGIELIQLKTPRVTELLLNNKKAPLNDVRVRQAIQAAIDVAGIAASVYEGTVTAAASAFAPGDPWAPKDLKPIYDPARAKALLEEAGIRPGQLQLELLAYTARAELKDIGAIIQAQLGEIGIKVNLRVAEYTAIEPQMISGDYDMALLSRGYLSDVADPFGFLSADYSCGGGYNMSHYCSEEVDALIEKASSLNDAQARYEIYAQLARKFFEEAVTVYLVNETSFDARSARVKNYEMHPLTYNLMTKDITLE
ncbi:peptide ABC transporter substrate-binding protein [Sinorhizobium saheli]|uniref:Peptide ABC transporter substrate-binding protein n=1 Tax=Sinorhizobium saheli TaxID=36856 RepID=A0A178XYR5_SINSA|nr:ABC transporter substrate-binding protein [Sinorhizobium saheli]OAP40254.1 peptide ABC transporter substrate-binding protein [Sinorhizobium saheli]